ncbi:MAG: FAD-dependent oxidoreductase [Candidatus Thorarchaeota archaeon]|nr:FAD-dependent oxidoreductase [Candidatus Thorarchaeota archaeon]
MKLLEKIKVGSLELENRLVMLATHLGYCEADGFINERVIEFYKERAKYRPGLIIVGGCFTEHFGRSGLSMIGNSMYDHLPGLSQLAESIHKYNVPVAAQLYHAGRYSHEMFIGAQPVSASSEYSRLFRSKPRPLTLDEIAGTIDNFGLSAERAKEAGFDAVEIIGSAGYLINQFLARATNKRKDEYNGDFRNRARFAIEVVESVREYVGDDFTILYRMSGNDFVENGTTLEENKQLAPWLVEAGVDCINVTGGWHETRVPQLTMDVPRGHYAYLAEGIAEVVDVPVIACNRITSPTIAESILQRGKAQLIGMSRGFIADPEITEKIRTNQSDRIRTCVGCNLGCLDHVFMMEPVTCAINPLAGYESERGIGPEGSGKVAVVGGGPAGMEAARILALRGFSVTLYEKEKRIGGLLNLASMVPLRGEFASYVVHMKRELNRLGVGIKLNSEATVLMLSEEKHDAIMYAAGTIPSSPPIDGVEFPHVTTAFDVIRNQTENLRSVSILGADALGCYAALSIASRAKSVDIFSLTGEVGRDIGRSTRWVILQALKDRKVKIHKDDKISQITSSYMMLESDEDANLFKTDTIITAIKPQPRIRLAEKLREAGFRVECVGSVKNSMNLLECIHDAFHIANTLEL